MSRGHLIIDGYNVLHAHPRYGKLIPHDIDAARASLVADLAGYAQGGPRTIVVFDGAGNPASDGAPHHLGALTVIFSATAISADAVVESLAQRFRERGESATVVTSDNATRDAVRSGSISVLSAEHFVETLTAENLERVEASKQGRRTPVAERIDPNVSEVLARWARGAIPPAGK